jgi:hypothetical protein
MRIIEECTPQWDNNEVKETIYIMGDGDQRIGLLEQRTGRYNVDSYIEVFCKHLDASRTPSQFHLVR